MRVIAQVDFHDNDRGIDRRRGEEFVVTQERFDEINKVGMERIGKPLVAVSAAEPKAEEQAEKKPAKAPRRRRAKA